MFPSSKPLADNQDSINSDNIRGVVSKREQILQGATRVFLRHGYAGTSMDRVAGEAGVSKQTIYTHFQDKEGLFAALIERITIRQLQEEFGTGNLQGEPVQLLSRIAHNFLSKMDDREYTGLLRVVVAESERFPELAALYTRTVIQPGNQCLSAYFRSHPQLQLKDPEATAQIFFGSLAAFILSQQILLGKHIMPMERERIVESLIKLVCPG
jgi:AcrR family transcriptional regulator